MSALPDRKELSRCHAIMRRICDCIWLALTLIIAGAGAVAWLLTRNLDHLYAGLFCAAFPFIGLIYHHCVLLNPRRDPVETQRRLVELDRKQQKNARTVALVNGSILLIASPLLIVIGVAVGAEDGVVGAIVGGIAGFIFLVGGLAGIAWWRRLRRKDVRREDD